MKHRDVELLLADYADRRLGPEQTSNVEQHVQHCPDCQGWLETYGLFSDHRHVLLDDSLPEAPPESLPPESHPDSQHLAARAAGQDVPQEVLEHLETCAECWQLVSDAAGAIERSGLFERESRPNLAARRSRRSPIRPLSLAAALLVASLTATLTASLTAWWLLDRPTTSETTSWAGPADVLVLASVTRAVELDDVLTIQPGQPYAAVALDLGRRLDEAHSTAQATVKIELERLPAAGRPAAQLWSDSWTAESLRAFQHDGGLLMLHWPTRLLEPGVYRVTVRAIAGEGDPPAIWQRRFRVAESSDAGVGSGP